MTEEHSPLSIVEDYFFASTAKDTNSEDASSVFSTNTAVFFTNTDASHEVANAFAAYGAGRGTKVETSTGFLYNTGTAIATNATMNGLMGDLINPRALNSDAYPFYNVIRCHEDCYVLEMAVAGFGPDDIEVLVSEGLLLISGRIRETIGRPTYWFDEERRVLRVGADEQVVETKRVVLHKGISQSAFTRKFALSPDAAVTGADFVNGLLRIEITRVFKETKRVELRVR